MGVVKEWLKGLPADGGTARRGLLGLPATTALSVKKGPVVTNPGVEIGLPKKKRLVSTA